MISFIIPTLNEENILFETISSIHNNHPSGFLYEIIIVDNGSTDNTVNLAKKLGSIVLHNPYGTIASSRNLGSIKSNGEILVFLDADVLLTQQWKVNFEMTAKHLNLDPYIVTGSRCCVDNEDKWLNKYWFCKLTNETPNYINSGHLIISKILFNKINGFNEHLETAEDYDLCQRALKTGAKIINNPSLLAIHTRYPKRIIDFINRERWHGKEDFKSLKNALSSKQAIIAFSNAFMLVICLSLFLIEKELGYIILYFTSMLFISAIITIIKFNKHRQIDHIFNTTIVTYFYITGRSLSLLDHLATILSKTFTCARVA